MNAYLFIFGILLIFSGLITLAGYMLIRLLLRKPKPYNPVRKSRPTRYSLEETFYISDNMGGFDGYLIDHRRGEKLPPGRYRVRDLGSADFRWQDFDYPPKE